MAEETKSPISAVKPPVASPLGVAKPPATSSTLKLKPVVRKPGAAGGGATALGAGIKLPVRPVVRAAEEVETQATAFVATPAPAAAAPKAEAATSLAQLKSVTQRLKDVTQEIPQQAILRKTGIIGDQAMTDAQKQASKARTSRISLSDAFGVAPVKEDAPMKTIRIKRPVDIAAPAAAKPAQAPVAAMPAPAAPEPESAPAAPVETSVTQRKTLKVSRPGAGRPTSKFGIKKPGVAPVHKPAEPAQADVADIPDIPDMDDAPTMATVVGMPPAELLKAAANQVPDVPKGLAAVSLIVQIAACLVMGALGWMLFQNTTATPF
ncbi:MAG: hypothetical protein J6P13_03075 [Kiritimatiellae bacterium]|nr:hypothetical protein [Kiritimatiellia bacterium]